MGWGALLSNPATVASVRAAHCRSPGHLTQAGPSAEAIRIALLPFFGYLYAVTPAAVCLRGVSVWLCSGGRSARIPSEVALTTL